MNTIYHYHPETREYLGQGDADESPLEPGVPLIPANSTLKVPPNTGDREAAVFDLTADDWIVMQDFRAVDLYSTLDGAPVVVTDLGPQPPETTEQPRPSPMHDWSGSGWEENIGKIKAAKWDAIKAKRDTVKTGGVKVGTKWYHTDTESRIQHLGLLEKARAARAAGGTDATRLQALGHDIKWKTMDGSFIYLTVKHAEDIFAAVTDLDATAFAAAETHRVAMEASANPAAYDFSVGWPATFAG